MVNFITNYEDLTGEKFIENNEIFNDLNKLITIPYPNDNQKKEMATKLEQYLKLIQEKCREKWSTFNTENCILGLVLVLLSIVVAIILTISLSNNDGELQLNYSNVLYKTVLTSFLGYLFSFFALGIHLKVSYLLLVLNFVLIIELRPLNKIGKFKLEFKLEYILFLLSLLIPFSNSFIITENITSRFILISVICVGFLSNCKPLSKSLFLTRLSYLIVLIFLIRVSVVFFVCREENLVYNCTESYFATQLSKISFDLSNNTVLSPFQIYIGFILFNFLLIILIILYILKSNTYYETNRVKYLFFFQLTILFSYWFIQLFNNISNDSLNSSKVNFYLARLFYIIFILAQYMIWRDEAANKDLSKFYLNKITNLIISLGLLITLISGQSSLSIWFLILALNIYSKHISTLSFGKLIY